VIDASEILVHPIAYRDPVTAFAPLAHEPFSILLGGGGTGAQSQFAYIAARPFQTIELKPNEKVTDPFGALRRALNSYRVRADSTVLPAPFMGGAVGFVGYEVGGALEDLPPRKPPSFPYDLAFGIYDTIAVFDLNTQKAWIISTGFPEQTPAARKARAAQRITEFSDALGVTELPPVVSASDATWTADLTEPAYCAKVESIIEAIRAGEIYQANMTQRWTSPWPNDLTPFALYRRLRAQSAAPFAAYLSLSPDAQIISASPERFLSVDTKGRVETRPIKGTRARGATPQEDQALATDLQASAKDRAENLMIVDLLRNDISRVCRAGSVNVPQLYALETFPTVHHLVSVVMGELRPECSAVDLLAACFPGGSITGAPKIQAMRVIHAQEPVARGPYCGTVAWLGFDGAMDSSIIIRTLIRSGEALLAQAGGGIVADSNPVQEYAESILKAKPLLAALNGHGQFTCASV